MSTTVKLKRGSGSDPSASDMVVGEPVIRTDTAELFFKKDDGSVAKVSGGGGGPDFKYLALRNAANDGSASYPGNDFTLVTSGTTTAVSPAAANTLLVSYGGVIQRPNSGTSTSGITGFIVDGSRFKTATNLAAAPDFILYQESGGIGEPSDNTVTSAKIVADAVTGAKIADDAVGAEHIEVLDAALQFGDNIQAQFGTGNDLYLYHNGTDSFIKNITGDLKIFLTGGTEEAALFKKDGAVELFYDGSKKFETASWGVDISGSLHLDDGAPATSGITVGNGNDIQIYHDGSHSYLQNGTGTLFIRAKTTETGISVIPDGAVELYYDNANKFNTDANGAIVTGRLYTSTYLDATQGIYIPDNYKANFGSGSDLQIYHSGTDSVIECINDHPLWLQSDGAIRLTKDAAAAYYATFNPGGSCELYWNGAKKFETTQYGAKISTTLSAGYLEVVTTGNLGDGHIEIKGGEGGGALISLTADEGDDNDDNWRIQNAGDNRLGFRSKKSGSWVEKLGITDYGDLHPTGHIFMDAGYGIAFSPYGGSSVNLLDDYEEGTWTPTSGVGSFTNEISTYTKIGRLVTFQIYGTFGSSSSGTGQYLTSFPFTGLSSTYYSAAVHSNTGSTTGPMGQFEGSSGRLYFKDSSNNGFNGGDMSGHFVNIGGFYYI